MMMHRIAVLCAALFLLGLGAAHGPSYAQSEKKRIQKNRDERDKLYEKIRSLNEQQGAIADQVAGVELQMESKEAEIRTMKRQLAEAQEKHTELEIERQKLEGLCTTQQSALAGRARTIYIDGEFGYAGVLLDAKSLGDLIDRLYFIQVICRHDEELITTYKSNQALVATKLDEIAAAIQSIGEIKSHLQIQRDQLLTLLGQKRDIMDAIDNDKNLYMKHIAELEAENKRIAELTRARQRSASGYKGKAWTSKFLKPCSGEITSGFGYRVHPIFGVRKMHTGVDIANQTGTPVKAAGDGKVIETARERGYGNMVLIDHGKGRTTLYGHLSSIDCKSGDLVQAGDVIGKVGSTGFATGPHLHFEVRINGDPVDPLGQ